MRPISSENKINNFRNRSNTTMGLDTFSKQRTNNEHNQYQNQRRSQIAGNYISGHQNNNNKTYLNQLHTVSKGIHNTPSTDNAIVLNRSRQQHSMQKRQVNMNGQNYGYIKNAAVYSNQSKYFPVSFDNRNQDNLNVKPINEERDSKQIKRKMYSSQFSEYSQSQPSQNCSYQNQQAQRNLLDQLRMQLKNMRQLKQKNQKIYKAKIASLQSQANQSSNLDYHQKQVQQLRLKIITLQKHNQLLRSQLSKHGLPTKTKPQNYTQNQQQQHQQHQHQQHQNQKQLLLKQNKSLYNSLNNLETIYKKLQQKFNNYQQQLTQLKKKNNHSNKQQQFSRQQYIRIIKQLDTKLKNKDQEIIAIRYGCAQWISQLVEKNDGLEVIKQNYIDMKKAIVDQISQTNHHDQNNNSDNYSDSNSNINTNNYGNDYGSGYNNSSNSNSYNNNYNSNDKYSSSGNR